MEMYTTLKAPIRSDPGARFVGIFLWILILKASYEFCQYKNSTFLD